LPHANVAWRRADAAVPSHGGNPHAEIHRTNRSRPGDGATGRPVNINKADAATIAKSLDGIGQSKADAIVAYRDANGPFKSADDLTQVKGIGKATLERNRASILLADAAAAPIEKTDSPAKKTKHASKKPAAAAAGE
jgi:competence protein ComEA